MIIRESFKAKKWTTFSLAWCFVLELKGSCASWTHFSQSPMASSALPAMSWNCLLQDLVWSSRSIPARDSCWEWSFGCLCRLEPSSPLHLISFSLRALPPHRLFPFESNPFPRWIVRQVINHVNYYSIRNIKHDLREIQYYCSKLVINYLIFSPLTFF